MSTTERGGSGHEMTMREELRRKYLPDFVEITETEYQKSSVQSEEEAELMRELRRELKDSIEGKKVRAVKFGRNQGEIEFEDGTRFLFMTLEGDYDSIAFNVSPPKK